MPKDTGDGFGSGGSWNDDWNSGTGGFKAQFFRGLGRNLEKKGWKPVSVPGFDWAAIETEHFDMDTLFAVADERIREEYEALFIGGDRDGSLQERIQHAVERHADGFESVTNLALSTSSQLWRSEVLRKNYARNQRGLRKDLDDWIPELKKLDRADRETIDAMASFEMWHRLRYHQGLSKSTSIDIIVRLLSNLIDD